jgi:hypothetical protein
MIDDDLPRRLRIEADALGTSPTSSQMLRNAATLIDCCTMKSFNSASG